jgi:hypothetical protein
MRSLAVLLPLALLGGCKAQPGPPAALWFDGLPVRGSLADAQRAGFTRCVMMDARSMRCRRNGVMVAGQGPYNAAVDLKGGDGSGGFHQLTLWNEGDQQGLYAVGEVFRKRGWSICRTGQIDRGDQTIYTRQGSRVRLSMDISYYSKRRLRVMPEAGQPTGYCWDSDSRPETAALIRR